MGCCSATIFVIALGFTAIYTFMVVYGKTHDGLDKDTADGLVAAGSVCLGWSLFYLVLAFRLMVSGNGLDTCMQDLSCRSKRSGWFVSAVLTACVIAVIVSIVLVAVGGAKGKTALWAAGLANLLYALVTFAWMLVSACFCTVITHSNH